MMVKQQYTVSFVTPAFLGDADQNGAWRTPPFKALLRQWWRVAAAKEHNYDHARLRETEGRLFGNAWIENNYCKSQVRLRLERWDEGKLKKSAWPGKDEKKLIHSEVTNKEGKTIPIGAELYLGYGPLIYDKDQKKTTLKANAAIQTDEKAKLELIYPNNQEKLDDVLQIIAWFGTIGGRSRNGWGSLILDGQGIEPLSGNHTIFHAITRPLADCLRLSWPHAIGKNDDGNLLIWKTKASFDNWRDTMKELARIKIAFRSDLIFSRNEDAHKPRVDLRHVLAYPITHHGVEGWCDKDEKTGKFKTDKYGYLKQSTRLANQLRFKVTKNAEGKYLGLAYHLPCGIPRELLDALSAADRAWIVGQQLSVWQNVHGILDQQMQRIQ